MKDGWQFPQGGIDAGESPEQALVREVWEEIGVTPRDFSVLERKGPYAYLYGNGRIKRGFHGKEQFYFLCDYTGRDDGIQVATTHPEFQDFCWIAPGTFRLDWLPPMKRPVYRAVLADFFNIEV